MTTTPTMPSTIPGAFEEDEGSQHENGNETHIALSPVDGPHLNASSKGHQGSPPPQYGAKSGGGGCSRLTKNTLFRVCLLLLILALLLPILILAALIYKNMNSGNGQPATMAGWRGAGGPQQEGDAKEQRVNGEESPVITSNNENEMYQKEPWRRNTEGAWKGLGTRIADSMDTGGDPCSDFYSYSCAQWKEKNVLNEEKEISAQTGAYNKVKSDILKTFETMKPDDSSWPAIVRWTKSFYDRCIQSDQAELDERRKGVYNFLSEATSASQVSQSPTHHRSRRNPQHPPNSKEHSTDSHGTMEPQMVSTSQSPPEHTHIQSGTDQNNTQSNSTPTPVPPPPVPGENTTGGPAGHSGEHREHATMEHSENVTVQGNVTDEQPEGSTLGPVSKSMEKNTSTVGPGPTNPVSSEISPSPTTPELNLWKLAGWISKNGVSSLFNIFRYSNSDSIRILSPPSLSMESRREYSDPVVFSKKSPHLIKKIIQIGSILNRATGKSDSNFFPSTTDIAGKIIQLEQAIAKASPQADNKLETVFVDELKSKYPKLQQYSLQELSSRWPSIDWKAFFPQKEEKSESNETTTVGSKETNKTRPKRSAESNQTNSEGAGSPYFVTDPAYVDQLVGLIKDTDQQTVSGYLKWRYVQAISPYLNSVGLNDTCYNLIESKAPLALANIVYKTNYSLTDEEKSNIIYTPESLVYLFNRTVRAFKSVLQYSNQFDNSTKTSLLAELDKRKLVTEWPDFIKNGETLDKLYSDDLNMKPSNSSFLNLYNDMMGPQALDSSSANWANNIPDAFTDVRFINGPTIASVLCPRLINGMMKESAVGQFGTLGWQMARQLARSLPLESDKNDQCLINQYNSFCYKPPINTCVDGTATLDENSADNIGLQVAHKAYSTWASMAASYGQADAFPAFLVASNLGKFTTDQIFFLAYGSSLCQNTADEYTSDLLANGEIAPQSDRLRGTVENSEDFQLSFHCKSTDKMYRDAKDRCQL